VVFAIEAFFIVTPAFLLGSVAGSQPR